MSVKMIYLLPMLLGRTFDINTDQPGVDIFPQKYIDEAKVISKHETESRYTMVERSTDVKNFLDVSGKLALKVKSLGLKIEGAGGYLSDAARRSKSVEILIRIHYETETRTLFSTAKPFTDWRNYKNLGTHFCRSITYGGDLIASLIFTTEHDEELEKIKGYVKGELQVGGTFDGNIKAKLDKLQKDLKGTASMEINYYATVPLHGIPRTLEGLLEIASNFHIHAKEVNGGLGIPLTMELYPLNFLDTAFPDNSQNSAFNSYLDQLEDQLDDLIATKQAITDWMSNLPPLLPTKLLNKISSFKKTIEDLVLEFRRTITELDLSSTTGTVEQFLPAFAAYRGTSTSLPDKYLRQFLRLKENLEKTFPEIKPSVGGATYVQWGRDFCNSSGVETVYSGNAMLFEKDAACIRHDAIFEDAKQKVEGPSLISKNLKCSLCHVTDGSTVFVQSGLNVCPDGWDKEYDGVLAHAGKYICINGGPELTSPAGILEVETFCRSLPCATYQTEGASLACAVCSK